MMNSKMLIFFLKNHSEFDKKILNLAKFSIFNQNHRCSYHNHKTNDYHCLLQCGVNCNSTETISTEMWKQLETQTKDWKGLDKVWEYI